MKWNSVFIGDITELIIFLCLLMKIAMASNERILPADVFILGVQKAATTSLYALMEQNVAFCSTTLKEKHFFNSNYSWEKGFNSYEEMFSSCEKGKLTIDSTPMFSDEKVPPRLKESYPSDMISFKKFIVIFREPISREFSFYEQQIRRCASAIYRKTTHNSALGRKSCEILMPSYTPHVTAFSTITFREYYQSNKLEIWHSYYLHQLKMWLESIQRSQLFVINMETLIYNTSDTMKRLQRFLGLNYSWGNTVTLPHKHDAAHINATLDCKTYDDLKSHFDRVNAGLLDYIRNSPDKPPQEPYFPDFQDSRWKCRPVTFPANFTVYIPP